MSRDVFEACSCPWYVQHSTGPILECLCVIAANQLLRYKLQSRVAMAWIQASIAAYYVAYAENPQSQQFDSTMTDTIQEMQRSQV